MSLQYYSLQITHLVHVIVPLISMNCFSEFSCSSLGFFKTAVLNNQFYHKILCLCAWCLENYCCHLVMFPWFFIFLVVSHCWFCTWSSRHFLNSLPFAFKWITLIWDFLSLSGYTCSFFLLTLVAELLSIFLCSLIFTTHQAGYWKPLSFSGR